MISSAQFSGGDNRYHLIPGVSGQTREEVSGATASRA
jgi:hypothetical protein